MDNPIEIRSNGKVYPFIACPNSPGLNGNVYRSNEEEIIINNVDVNEKITIINDGYIYNDKEYQCFTLGPVKEGEYHNIKANKDLYLNYILIGSGAPGSNFNNSASPCIGGNAGSVISGYIHMKKDETFDCYISNSNKEINTLEYLGKDIPYEEIGGDINIYENVTQYSKSSSIVGNNWSIVSGGAIWPNSTNEVNINNSTLPCAFTDMHGSVEYFLPTLTSFIISDNLRTYTSRVGGSAFNRFGLSAGFYNQSVEYVNYQSIPIFDHNYFLPCGSAAGGINNDNISEYSINYNNNSIPFSLSTQNYAGCNACGSGYGNIFSSKKRLIDAYLPGAGGGGSYSGNQEKYSNGYGAQGALICWIEK